MFSLVPARLLPRAGIAYSGESSNRDTRWSTSRSTEKTSIEILGDALLLQGGLYKKQASPSSQPANHAISMSVILQLSS
jgi:hypothetical protein